MAIVQNPDGTFRAFLDDDGNNSIHDTAATRAVAETKLRVHYLDMLEDLAVKTAMLSRLLQGRARDTDDMIGERAIDELMYELENLTGTLRANEPFRHLCSEAVKRKDGLGYEMRVGEEFDGWYDWMRGQDAAKRALDAEFSAACNAVRSPLSEAMLNARKGAEHLAQSEVV